MYKKGIPKNQYHDSYQMAIAFKRACLKTKQKISILLSLICIDDNIIMNKNKKDFTLKNNPLYKKFTIAIG